VVVETCKSVKCISTIEIDAVCITAYSYSSYTHFDTHQT